MREKERQEERIAGESVSERDRKKGSNESLLSNTALL